MCIGDKSLPEDHPQNVATRVACSLARALEQGQSIRALEANGGEVAAWLKEHRAADAAVGPY
jgi:hypothetical protein